MNEMNLEILKGGGWCSSSRELRRTVTAPFPSRIQLNITGFRVIFELKQIRLCAVRGGSWDFFVRVRAGEAGLVASNVFNFELGFRIVTTSQEINEMKHKPTMVSIPAGDDTDAFSMSDAPITFDEFDEFCEATGRTKPDDYGYGRGNLPVVGVTWYDAVAYCKWLTEETGIEYRLPTEQEWEYACRAGSDTAYHFGDDPADLDEYAWYYKNSDNRPHPVRQKKPNAWGLYDMHGLVWEWTASPYDPEEK